MRAALLGDEEFRGVEADLSSVDGELKGDEFDGAGGEFDGAAQGRGGEGEGCRCFGFADVEPDDEGGGCVGCVGLDG